MTFIINKSHVGASPRTTSVYPRTSVAYPRSPHEEEKEVAERTEKYLKTKRSSGKKASTKKQKKIRAASAKKTETHKKELREKSQRLLKTLKAPKKTIRATPMTIETALSKQARKLGITETELKRKINAINKYKFSKNP